VIVAMTYRTPEDEDLHAALLCNGGARARPAWRTVLDASVSAEASAQQHSSSSATLVGPSAPDPARSERLRALIA
jgi:hypothetical protein